MEPSPPCLDRRFKLASSVDRLRDRDPWPLADVSVDEPDELPPPATESTHVGPLPAVQHGLTMSARQTNSQLFPLPRCSRNSVPTISHSDKHVHSPHTYMTRLQM
ncbi:hypothetical protein RRG08_009870 [Elysia crispata]|uniref:Uncharacterized protein n=1 Tax=Elysia crispata TaxID=231223 RepID=A0AAE1D9R0_9GAST|nr:hypothetical protein RRG08_009870 [Elysia crispata]